MPIIPVFLFSGYWPKNSSFSHFRAAIKKMGGGEVVSVRRARQTWPQRRRSISSVKNICKLVWVLITPTCASVRRRSLADHQSAMSLLSEGPRSPKLHLNRPQTDWQRSSGERTFRPSGEWTVGCACESEKAPHSMVKEGRCSRHKRRGEDFDRPTKWPRRADGQKGGR